MKKLFVVLLSVISVCVRAQMISYIHPDAAAPGMVVYSEVIGPDINGNFGNDGFAQASIELVNPADALRFVVAPSVTSWNGRVISIMALIPEGAALGPIPFRIVVNGHRSNVDTFYIVQPQSLNLASAGALGSGGQFGTRSRRNTLVVDGLTIPRGRYTVSDVDPDPLTPGNQAYLPMTILSRGPVRIAGELSVSGVATNAIAGGGGGGARETTVGGNGFTAGGGDHETGGISSGDVSSGWNGAASLNGAPGGGGLGDRWFDDQGSGGGTGFPFGTASRCGTWWNEGGDSPAGGIGAGSGGGERWLYSSYSPDSSFGGGGGGFATDGECSGTGGFNGGKAYGNSLLVPFCGGSGGGGGNQYGGGHAGSGGAGGGAIHIFSLSGVDVTGSITADGADGESTQNHTVSGGGGGGSGGAIALTAPFVNVTGSLSVKGGKGGLAVHQAVEGGLDGGHGGEGRIRVIGLTTNCPSAVARYEAPAITEAALQDGKPYVKGTGKAYDEVTVLPLIDNTWQMSEAVTATVTEGGTWTISDAAQLKSATSLIVIGKLTQSDGMFAMSPNPVTPNWKAADVMTKGDARFEVTSLSFSAAELTVSLHSSASKQITVYAYDVLGRMLTQTTATTAQDGISAISLPSTGANGACFIVATDGEHTASRAIAIIR